MDESAIAKVNQYISEGHKAIDGWFYDLDMALFFYIFQAQNMMKIKGDTCEVGVYKGKSLVLIALMSGHDDVIAIDLFDTQYSGETYSNLEKYLGKDHGILMHEINTANADKEFLADAFTNSVRFIHIDAGHEYHEVLHDLLLFCNVLSDSSVIVMDDSQDREFPGIIAAIYDFCRRPEIDFVPFLVGGNKLYLCHKAYSKHYQSTLLEMPFFQEGSRVTKMPNGYILIPGSKMASKRNYIEEAVMGDNINLDANSDLKDISVKANKYGTMNVLKQKA